MNQAVLEKMASPQIPHYSLDAIGVYNACVEKLKPMFGLRNGGNVYIFPGSGSVAMEVCAATFIARGDRIIVAVNGTFGQRVRDQAASYGADIVDVRVEEGCGVKPEHIEAAILANPEVKLVMVVHLETSTGVLNPIRDIGQVVRKYGIPCIVDAVSSFGTEELDMEAWGISACGTATQKGLETPPGLGIVAVSKTGWDTLLERKTAGNGWFLNLFLWKKVQEGKEIRKGIVYPLPVTMPVNNVMSLLESLEEIEREGLDLRIRRHADIALAVRLGMNALGFEPFPEEGCFANGVTSVKNNLGIDVSELIECLKETVHIEISNGLFDHYNKMIRIGHYGQTAEKEYVIPLLFGIEQFLRKKGIAVPLGAGLVGMQKLCCFS